MTKKIVVQDTISKKDEKMTCGSDLLDEFVSPYSSTIVERLEENGYELDFIKSNCEFNLDSTDKNYANTDQSFVGGSAVDIGFEVLNSYDLGLGTDTKGDIILSGSALALYGFRPSPGLISNYGVFTSTNDFDTVGFIGKDIKTIKDVFSKVLGKDEKDFNTRDIKETKEINSLSELKIASIGDIDTSFLTDTLSIEVDKISNIDFDLITSVYMILSSVSFASNTARFDGIRYGKSVEDANSTDELYQKTRSKYLSKLTKEKILLGYFFLEGENKETYYDKAVSYLEHIRSKFNNYLDKYDFIISPSLAETNDYQGLNLYKNAKYTLIPSLCKYPSLGLKLDGQDLQIIGSKDDDMRLLDFADKIGGKND